MLIARENPLRFLGHKLFFGQSVSAGLAHVASSFAYMFAPPSVIVAALRSFAILFGLLSGRLYFREKHFLVKAGLFFLVTVGLILLVPRP